MNTRIYKYEDYKNDTMPTIVEASTFKKYDNIKVRDSELEAHIINFITLNPNSDILDIALSVRDRFDETDTMILKILKSLVQQRLILSKGDKYSIR